ncbi:MAG: ATP-binding protein [Phycisphaerae bacterium]
MSVPKHLANPAMPPPVQVGDDPARIKQREARLNQLAEMGNVAAGLAHELKNPLSTLKLNLQLLEEDLAQLPDSEGYQTRVGILKREADRILRTINDFLRYAGRMEIHRVPTGLNGVIREVVEFIQPQAQAAKVRVHVALDGQEPVGMLDAHILKQGLHNLMINAIEAMSGGPEAAGGDMMIRTHTAGDKVYVDISDTGPGLPSEQSRRIFDAYYTTKKHGSGLGLPITRRVVEEHQGHIELTSIPGQGSNFRIELPLLRLAQPTLPPTQ